MVEGAQWLVLVPEYSVDVVEWPKSVAANEMRGNAVLGQYCFDKGTLVALLHLVEDGRERR